LLPGGEAGRTDLRRVDEEVGAGAGGGERGKGDVVVALVAVVEREDHARLAAEPLVGVDHAAGGALAQRELILEAAEVHGVVRVAAGTARRVDRVVHERDRAPRKLGHGHCEAPHIFISDQLRSLKTTPANFAASNMPAALAISSVVADA